MTRTRSPETQARYYRTVLRNARLALRVAADPASSHEHRRDLAQLVIRQIDEELAPRRARKER